MGHICRVFLNARTRIFIKISHLCEKQISAKHFSHKIIKITFRKFFIAQFQVQG